MKKTLFILAAFGLIAASCAKEVMKSSDTETKTKGRTVLTVGLPDEGKVNIGPETDRKLYWSKGDQLSWNGKKSDPLVLDQDNPKQGTFTWDKVLDRPGKLIYPASFWKDGTHITLPANQGTMAGADDIAPNSFPLCGYVEKGAGSKNLSPLCAIVRLQIKNAKDEAVTLKKVSFSGNNNEQVSGVFTIDYQDCSLTDATAANDADKSTSVSCDKTLSKSDAIFVNMVVPARTYSAGVKFTLEDAAGRTMVKGKKSPVTLSAGKVISFPNFDCYTADIEISNADEWNAFATAYNAKPESQIVSIVGDLDFKNKSIVTLTQPFGGTIEGNGHYFKNVQLTNVAIVDKLTADGKISKVKIDSGSKLSVTNEAKKTYYAPLVADHQGLVEGCESAANVEFIVTCDADNVWFIGGLTGRSRGGSLKNCSVSGTLKDIEVATASQYSYIGGITGDINGNGIVEGCHFSGKILMGPDAGTDNSGVTGVTCSQTTGFRIGGITGRNSSAEITNSSTTNDAVIDIRGDMLVIYVGGIVGYAQNDVKGCNNYAKISIGSNNTDILGGASYVGGIAGYCSTNISTCNNFGSTIINARHRNTNCGGIIGALKSDGEVKTCTNNGNIIQRDNRPRYLCLGGILGNNVKGTVSDVHNNESVSVNGIPNNADKGYAYCGGIVGYNKSNIDGTEVDNSGAVEINISSVKSCLEVAVGGVIGCNNKSLSGAKNTGPVTVNCTKKYTSNFTAIGGVIGLQRNDTGVEATVSNCTNEGPNSTSDFITGNIAYYEIETCNNWFEGGIIGYVEESKLNVTGCTNDGLIHHLAKTEKIDGRCSSVGGIIGKIKCETQKVIIYDSHSYGNNSNENYNNSAVGDGHPFLGGIVGYAKGSENYVIEINDSYVQKKSSKIKNEDVQIYVYRGTAGGVVGYASYVNVSNCTVSRRIYSNANALYAGGLVGYAEHTSIVGGGFSGPNMLKGKNQGGIVSYLGSSSSVFGSKFNSSITEPSEGVAGAIAAVSETGTTITNAKIGSNVKVLNVAASTDNAYVCPDCKATIKGTTIE